MDGNRSGSLWQCFATLRDPRRSNRDKKHLLLDIVAIALCAVIAGANDFPQIAAFGRKRSDWLKTFLSLPNGIPSHDTFERIVGRLSPAGFRSCLLCWLHECSGKLSVEHLAIDGKTMRHSGSPTHGLAALHLVSVWATQANLSLGQVAVDHKSNEITAIPRLLELLNLQGALVTIDAMGCQKEIARRIVAGGGDYLLTVKDNQKGLYDDILDRFVATYEVDFAGCAHDCYAMEERGHGRLEKRSYTVLYDPDGIRDQDKWDKLTAIGICHSERTVGDKTTEEMRLFISSRRATAKEYGGWLRGHWRIENSLHWQLDVTFGEDDSRIQERQRAQNFALLRRWALSLLQQHPDKASIAVKRFNAALDPKFLEEVLDG